MSDLEKEGDRLAVALRAALGEPDPLKRYQDLTAVQAGFDAMVSAIKLARGAALDEVPAKTLAELAELAGLGSYQKVQKLVNAARAAQREEQAVGTTTWLHEFGTYDHSHHTPKDAVRDYLGEFEGDCDVDGLTIAYQAAINAELDGTGITLNGAEFLADYPAPDDATELIEAAIKTVDLGALAAEYDTTEEQS